ncbi:hypothetical protein BKH41_02960 [Helicobacter sp. 12S02232-10]|uniref:phage holin family protein n=1 Tax=Helicobacter sp. 12S02232-10 TaxID=1476197 RepID=UPI000BA6DCCF|nr:phage holin family protein [Helicobacter sp. 12S02232-10]PAF49066.1 hypothetical protein BKH41_02960 [Helicobacter sp. 12S02232-10]
MSAWEIFKLYLFVIIVGFAVGILYILRAIQEEPINSKSKAIQFVLYGVGSSMLVTWIGYEISIYYGLPASLSCAIGGGLGFIGAETIARLLIKLFKKKTGIGGEEK